MTQLCGAVQTGHEGEGGWVRTGMWKQFPRGDSFMWLELAEGGLRDEGGGKGVRWRKKSKGQRVSVLGCFRVALLSLIKERMSRLYELKREGPKKWKRWEERVRDVRGASWKRRGEI